MRTMETLELGLTAEELQALANGEQLTAPLEENQRLLLYAVPPEQAIEESEDADSPDEISEGAEVDAE